MAELDDVIAWINMVAILYYSLIYYKFWIILQYL